MSRNIFLVAFLILFLVGCSGKLAPTTPSAEIENVNNQSPIGVMVEGYDSGGMPLGTGILGLYQASIEIENLSGEIVPLRQSSTDNVVECVDMTNFLSMAPCIDCVKIKSIELDSDNHILARIGVKHPFPAGDPLKPITGQNRADLHVFNIEGTVIFDDSSSSQVFPGIGDTMGPDYLVNADGYSGYLDIPLDDIYPTDATVHPYIMHFDDYSEGNFNPSSSTGFTSVTTPPPTGNLVMAMGADYDYQDYIFDIPSDTSIDFILAIGCTYAVTSTNKTMRFTPEYQVPQHNKKAASEVGVEIVSNNLIAGDTNSSAILHISVLDINHGVAVGDALNEMKYNSSVAGLVAEVPSITLGTDTGSITPLGGNGRDPNDPLIFEMTIHNDQAAGNGAYAGLVKVLDSYPPGINETDLPDGIGRVDPGENPIVGAFSIDEFATYQTFILEIGATPTNIPPVVELDASSTSVASMALVDFYPGAGTYDPDANNLVLYEYDFDYDGVTFDIDDFNMTGNPVTHQYANTGTTPVDFTAALRVTDDGIPPAFGIGTLVITVNPEVTIGPEFQGPPDELPYYGPFQHGHQKDPSVCLESDGEMCISFLLQEYFTTGGGDTLNCVHSTDGINWTWTEAGIGSGGMVPPIKLFPDSNDGDSYTYYASNAPPIYHPDYYNWLTRSGGSPYEYSWFNLPFDHAGEGLGSLASGYIFIFGDDNDRLEVRRSTTPHFVIDPWYGPIIPPISDTDPRISYIRSAAELSDGSMFLVYFNSNENVIKYIKSGDIMGNTWAEGTIWFDTLDEYASIKNPGIMITPDNEIHVSFVRQEVSSSEYQICYTSSTDGGTTFSEPGVAVVSTYPLLNAPVLAGNYFGQEVVLLSYSDNGNVMVIFSSNGGASFGSPIAIGDSAFPEIEPDMAFDSAGDVIFVWEVNDPVWNGSAFTRKASISEL